MGSGESIAISNRKLTILRTLGEGGYSFVYEAQDIATGEHFALKRILAQDATTLINTQREISLMEKLPKHDNIVGFYGAVKREVSSGTFEFFLLLEFCPQKSLTTVMNGGFMSDKNIWFYFFQACSAVLHMHCQPVPIAHRDLKIENFLIGRDGNIRLCDFGSATSRAQRYSTKQEIMEEEERVQKYSTAEYCAPELVNLYSNVLVNHKVDIWALGCVLFNMAYYTHAFDGPMSIASGRYLIPEKYERSHHRNVPRLIRWMLTPDPSERPDLDVILQIVERFKTNPQDEEWMSIIGWVEPSFIGLPSQVAPVGKKSSKSSKHDKKSSKKKSHAKPPANEWVACFDDIPLPSPSSFDIPNPSSKVLPPSNDNDWVAFDAQPKDIKQSKASHEDNDWLSSFEVNDNDWLSQPMPDSDFARLQQDAKTQQFDDIFESKVVVDEVAEEAPIKQPGDNSTSLELNQNIQIKYKKQLRNGIVRYIGPLTDKEGIWLGLELDEAVGNHNGMDKFSCAHNHGLFLRVEGTSVN